MDEQLTRLVNDVRTLIAADEFEQALDRLKTAVHGHAGDLGDEVVLQEGRFRRLQRDQRKGLLAPADFDREQNRLRAAVLDLVSDLNRRFAGPAKGVQGPPPPPPKLETESFRHEKIIGIHNLKQIAWIEVGLRAARSVCRILCPGPLGTGFLVGPDLLMTNNHVLPDAATAGRALAEFNYQEDGAGGFLPAARYAIDPSGFVTSEELDFSLVRIVSAPEKPATATWGHVRLNANADPTPSEHVTIVQHPNGGYKQIAMTANWIVATQGHFLHYTTDTMPGSSGAPVFNDSWHAIAIHHSGGDLHQDANGAMRYVNEGILMSAIRAHLGGAWPQ